MTGFSGNRLPRGCIMTARKSLFLFAMVVVWVVAAVLGCCRYSTACPPTGVGFGYSHVGVGTSYATAAYYQPTVAVQAFAYPYTPTVTLPVQASIPVAAPPPVCACPQVPVGVPAQTYQPPVSQEPPVAAPPPVQAYATQTAVGVSPYPGVGVGYGTVGVGAYGVGVGNYGVGVGYGTGVRFGVGRVGYGGVGVVGVGRRVFASAPVVGVVPVVGVRVEKRGLFGRRTAVTVAPAVVGVGAVRVESGRKGVLGRLRERRNRRASLDLVPEPGFAVGV